MVQHRDCSNFQVVAKFTILKIVAKYSLFKDFQYIVRNLYLKKGQFSVSWKSYQTKKKSDSQLSVLCAGNSNNLGQLKVKNAKVHILQELL